jgi:hypothetical protein
VQITFNLPAHLIAAGDYPRARGGESRAALRVRTRLLTAQSRLPYPLARTSHAKRLNGRDHASTLTLLCLNVDDNSQFLVR